MGETLRVPKEVYIKHGVIKFFAKNKQIHYKVLLWTSDGLSEFVFKTGKLETSVNELVVEIKSTLQNFLTSQNHETEIQN